MKAGLLFSALMLTAGVSFAQQWIPADSTDHRQGRVAEQEIVALVKVYKDTAEVPKSRKRAGLICITAGSRAKACRQAKRMAASYDCYEIALLQSPAQNGKGKARAGRDAWVFVAYEPDMRRMTVQPGFVPD